MDLFYFCVSRLSLLIYCLVCSLQSCDRLLGNAANLYALLCLVFLVFLSHSNMVSLVRSGT